MSHPSVPSSSPGSPQQPQNLPQPGLLGRAWNGTKWIAQGAAWGATRPVALPLNYMLGSGSQTVGSGLASGVKREIEQMVQPDGPLGVQLKQTLEHALLQQPPQELVALKDLLDKAVRAPTTLTGHDLLAIRDRMRLLSDQDYELLNKLAPDFPPESMGVVTSVFESFDSIGDGINRQDQAGAKADLIAHLQDESFQQILTDFQQLFNEILRRNQGALNQALTRLQIALLSEEGGMLSQMIETLKTKCTDENTGLLQQVVGNLNTLLNKQGGTLDILEHRLLDENTGMVSKVTTQIAGKLQEKVGAVHEQLLGEGGTLDLLEERFLNETTGMVSRASTQLAGKLQENVNAVQEQLLREGGTVDRAISLLQQKLMAQGGLVDNIDQRFTAHAHPLLSQSRTAMVELRLAIIANKPRLIQQHSRTLETLLPLLELQSASVFTRVPLHADDLARLQQLRGLLASFYAEAPPTQNEMLTHVETGLRALDTYYGSCAGIAERTGDIMCEKITGVLNPVMSWVDNMPRNMVNNLLGRNPTGQPPAPALPQGQVPPPADPSQPQEGTISQFLDMGGSLLNSILSRGSDAVSKKSLAYFADVLKMGVQGVIDNMGDGEAIRPARVALETLIASLNGIVAGQGGTLSELKTQIKNVSGQLLGVKIYVSGFRIPKIGSSSGRPKNAEITFAGNVDALKKSDRCPKTASRKS